MKRKCILLISVSFNSSGHSLILVIKLPDNFPNQKELRIYLLAHFFYLASAQYPDPNQEVAKY